MTSTSRLSLPVIEAAQAQKHVTHNEALVLLDALTQLTVESRTLAAPPGSPAEGACYIPATGASGAWSGWDGQIAVYSGGWFRIVPLAGLKAWVRAERLTVTYEDGVWKKSSRLPAPMSRRRMPLSFPTAPSCLASRRARRSPLPARRLTASA
jgi:hypothetical protein